MTVRPIAPVQVTDLIGLETQTFGMHRARPGSRCWQLACPPGRGSHRTIAALGLEQGWQTSRLCHSPNGAAAEGDIVIAGGRPSTRELRHYAAPPSRPRSSMARSPIVGVLPHQAIPHWPKRSLADVARQGKAYFLTFPVRSGELIQLCRPLSPADAEMKESWSGARRSGHAFAASSTAGNPPHRDIVGPGSADVFVGRVVRPRARCQIGRVAG